MITNFGTLCTLGIEHAYYGGLCRDFDFIVPAETASLLRGGRLLAKVQEGKLHLLFETTEGGGPLVSSAGRKLRFGLKLLNPFFGNVTEVGPASPGTIRLYRNSGVPSSLDGPLDLPIIGDALSHGLTAAERPVTVTVTDCSDRVMRSETITDSAGRENVSFDLAGYPSGICATKEIYPAGTVTTSFYRDPELLGLGIFGIVEIGIEESFHASPPKFVLSFAAREEVLKYYVVAGNFGSAEFGSLSVVDAGFAEEGRAQIQFTKVAAAAFTPAEIPSALLGGSGFRVVLFRSQAPVPRRERARKKIQLHRNGDVLIPHLTQPGADKAGGDVIVHISKP